MTLPFWKHSKIHLKQVKEFAELVGFETRNKYQISDVNNQPIGWCAEQSKSLLGFIVRQFLGHWRSFELVFFDINRQPVFVGKHPFRFFFQRFEVTLSTGQFCGALQQRFSILYKSFDMEDSSGNVVAKVRSPIWRLWTFVFTREGRDVAIIRKKWGGLLKEAFLDADSFELEVLDSTLPEGFRILLAASAIFIDLQYFEKKAS